MDRELSTSAEVISVLGGLGAVSDLTGAEYKAVSNWKSSGSFPSRTFLVLTGALRRRGFSAPASLWGMVGINEVAS